MDKIDMVIEQQKEYRASIEKRLDKIDEKLEELRDSQSRLDKNFNIFKVKASIAFAFLMAGYEGAKKLFIGS